MSLPLALSDPATTGLFTLAGAIVGGLIAGTVTFGMERRREGWTAKRDARLFQPALTRISLASYQAVEERWAWSVLCGDVITTNLAEWDEYQKVFAGTLRWDDWFTIYKAVRAAEQLTHMAPETPGARIKSGDAKRLEDLADKMAEAAAVLIFIGISGPRRRRVRGLFIGLWRRIKPIDEDKLLREAGIEPELFKGNEGEQSS